MINNISLTTVWVKDIEESKAFYIDKLGFEERDDVRLGEDFRWCTIGHPSQPEIDVHLSTPGPPLSPHYVEALTRALDEGGTFAVGLDVDDCAATISDLEAKGVEIINQPEERPYGVEALIRDNTGNWLVLVESREFTQEDMEEFAGKDPSTLNPLQQRHVRCSILHRWWRLRALDTRFTSASPSSGEPPAVGLGARPGATDQA